MNSTVKKALVDTVPVLTGYLVLGFGFGIILKSGGYGFLLALAMSTFVYAGSMQYAAIGLFAEGASLITVALTTIMVNARHIFYGISMLDKYKGAGKIKPYLIFSLTDETYSLVCRDGLALDEEKRKRYYLFVSVFNHSYWIIGTLLGVAAGTLLKFNTEGIDFALTALFVTVFLEQWISMKKYVPQIFGVGVSAICLLVFGAEKFLIPSMLIIALALCFYKEKGGQKDE